MRKILVILFAVFLVSCVRKSPRLQADSFAFDKGKRLAEVKNKKIFEASGIAASINNPGLLWIHNDSGNDPEVFLIDEKLNVVLTCKLNGATNRDWEDIAVGPGPDSTKNYIYIGEIGDNLSQHPIKIIYRFEEPVRGAEKSIAIKDVEKITFQFSDGAKDAETVMINPLTRDLYVVSKRERPVIIYKLPFPQSIKDTMNAKRIASVDAMEIVGGDISKDGKEILMKNIRNVFYWTVSDTSNIEETLHQNPKVLPYDKEPQGEAICFARDGSGYFTIGEKIMGERSYLQFYKRK
jgi:hypothetical protein